MADSTTASRRIVVRSPSSPPSRLRWRRLGFWFVAVLCAVAAASSLMGVKRPSRSAVFHHVGVSAAAATNSSLKFVVDPTAPPPTNGAAWSPSPSLQRTNETSHSRGAFEPESNSSNSQKRRRRPLLVLHIGPHKTATSTLQCDLSYHFAAVVKEKKDSNNSNSNHTFVYLGRQYGECLRRDPSTVAKFASVDTRRLISCLDRHTSWRRPCDGTAEFAKFNATLAAVARRHQNIVVSDEAFSRMKVRDMDDNTDNGHQLLLATLSEQFDVRLAVSYRRYFAWVLSKYNEHYKPLPNRKHYQRWPGPGQNGSRMRPFAEFYRRLEELRSRTDADHIGSAAARGDYQLAADRLNVHPAAYLQTLWTRQAASRNIALETILVNIHENDDYDDDGDDDESKAGSGEGDDDVTGRFVRRALSQEAYQWYRAQTNNNNNNNSDNSSSSQRPPGRPNPSWNLDYNMLAVEAREQGLFNRTHPRLTRSKVARYIEQVFRERAVDPDQLPRVCLNETERRQFRRRSLDLERTAFVSGDSNSGNDERTPAQLQRWRERHAADFARAARSHRFCNLDARRLLLDPGVRAAFELLNAVQ